MAGGAARLPRTHFGFDDRVGDEQEPGCRESVELLTRNPKKCESPCALLCIRSGDRDLLGADFSGVRFFSAISLLTGSPLRSSRVLLCSPTLAFF